MLHLHLQALLGNGVTGELKQLVTDNKIHPILVNFTAALVPVSVGCDVAGRLLRREALRTTAWWTLFLAAAITPFTVAAGWLFWMPDDEGVRGMAIHKWLGTAMAVVLVALVLWRGWAYRRDRWPHPLYLLAGLIAVGAMAYQGHLGGDQSFGAMEASHSDSSSSGNEHKHDQGQKDDHGLQWRDHIDLKDDAAKGAKP